MVGVLVVLVLLLPFLELLVFIQVCQVVGFLPAVAALIGISACGVYVARHHGMGLVSSFQEALATGTPPSEPLLDRLMLMIGGVLLAIPGFLTAGLGATFFIPAVRRWYAVRGFAWVRDQVKDGHMAINLNIGGYHFTTGRRDDSTVETKFERVDDKRLGPR